MSRQNYLVQHCIDMFFNVDVLASSEEEAKELALERLKSSLDVDHLVDNLTCANIVQCEPTLDGCIELN